jgi:diguanylate cyclase (GGDEF)-like protein
VYQAGLAALAFLCLLTGAYAARMRGRARSLRAALEAAQRRESEVLEAVRVLVAASRESTDAVLTALDRTLRVLVAEVDDVLVFAASAEELVCIFAAGSRTEHFKHLRMRRDHPALLPAQAAARGHRVHLDGGAQPVIPTDRAALAVPMLGADGVSAVVYAATRSARIANPDVLVRAVTQAAAPYALALDRQADRAKATYDGLTGLYTPRAFREMLAAELSAACVRRHTSIALWFVDTDKFKQVNDTYGHAAGDVVLQRMASLLREHMLEGLDVPARNGGDEFCAMLRNVQKTAAIERAQRFCDAVRECDFGIGAEAITASVGVAAFPYDATDAGELLEAADAAMYHSKRSGRDRVSFAVEREAFAVYG